MTLRGTFLAVLATLAVMQTGEAQGPFMGGFGDAMMGMQANMANMAAGMARMGHAIRYQSQAMAADSARRSQWARRFGPGGREFRTRDGGNGYAYNSPDGSFSSYSYSSGAPSGGYMFHYGPHGTYERRW